MEFRDKGLIDIDAPIRFSSEQKSQFLLNSPPSLKQVCRSHPETVEWDVYAATVGRQFYLPQQCDGKTPCGHVCAFVRLLSVIFEAVLLPYARVLSQGMRAGLHDYNDTWYRYVTLEEGDIDVTPFDLLHRLDKTFVCQVHRNARSVGRGLASMCRARLRLHIDVSMCCSQTHAAYMQAPDTNCWVCDCPLTRSQSGTNFP